MNPDDGGYVHRPGETDAAAEARESESGDDGDGFGTRGWVLVAVLVVCLLVVPGVIYVRPGVLSAIGIPYIASLLVLPLLPAAVLGLTAVWAMTAATDDE
ncbi:hypothetical protein [Halobellus limi]|uniref:Uncharacterized protein n=1 Tax=Halobellus limi TaxID=699433 RepID=A0A1H5TD87_9EURY|nr:hypothetical protein [Halobellus limi]QCC47355.1 hypothetical protein DV707_06595 [Halobellus limi]SEF60051.1 hypothetical protein SAMN04488133_0229 [Halobellus limi]